MCFSCVSCSCVCGVVWCVCVCTFKTLPCVHSKRLRAGRRDVSGAPLQKVEPDLDVINTEAALDRFLENGVVRDIPRDEGAGMKHLTTRWEKTLEETRQRVGVQSSLRGTRIQMAGVPGRPLRPGSFILHWSNCEHSLAQATCANLHTGLHGCPPPSS